MTQPNGGPIIHPSHSSRRLCALSGRGLRYRQEVGPVVTQHRTRHQLFSSAFWTEFQDVAWVERGSRRRAVMCEVVGPLRPGLYLQPEGGEARWVGVWCPSVVVKSKNKIRNRQTLPPTIVEEVGEASPVPRSNGAKKCSGLGGHGHF